MDIYKRTYANNPLPVVLIGTTADTAVKSPVFPC